MATAAAVERFRAQGKQQLNVWVDSDTAALLKTLATQNAQPYGDVLRDALIALHSGQPAAPATPATGGAALDRESVLVTGLREEVASLRAIVGDLSRAFESRLSDLQDDLEARLSAVEATINTAPETPLKPAPGANEAAKQKLSAHAPKAELEARRKRIKELHAAGNSTSQISHILKAENFVIGVKPSDIHKFLYPNGLSRA